MSKEYFVYILASRSRNLYTGIAGDLIRRMVERRGGLVPGFTSRYRIFRLVHFEAYGDVREAIDREKEIEGWRREKKSWLVERHNPAWQDLAAQLLHDFRSVRSEKQIPHRRSPKAGDRVRDDKRL